MYLVNVLLPTGFEPSEVPTKVTREKFWEKFGKKWFLFSKNINIRIKFKGI